MSAHGDGDDEDTADSTAILRECMEAYVAGPPVGMKKNRKNEDVMYHNAAAFERLCDPVDHCCWPVPRSETNFKPPCV